MMVSVCAVNFAYSFKDQGNEHFDTENFIVTSAWFTLDLHAVTTDI